MPLGKRHILHGSAIVSRWELIDAKNLLWHTSTVYGLFLPSNTSLKAPDRRLYTYEAQYCHPGDRVLAQSVRSRQGKTSNSNS